MSPWQVYKFGGSSLGAEGRLPVVLRRVAEAQRPLAVVVSALGDTTEWLLEAGRAATGGGSSSRVEQPLGRVPQRAHHQRQRAPGLRHAPEHHRQPALGPEGRAAELVDLPGGH